MKIIGFIFIFALLACHSTQKAVVSQDPYDILLVVKQTSGYGQQPFRAIFYEDGNMILETKQDTLVQRLSKEQVEEIRKEKEAIAGSEEMIYDSETVDLPWRYYMELGGKVLVKSRGMVAEEFSEVNQLIDSIIPNNPLSPSIIPGEWLVYLNGTLVWSEVQAMANLEDPQIVKKIAQLGNVWLITIDPTDEESYVEKLRKLPEVRAVEPNQKIQLRDR